MKKLLLLATAALVFACSSKPDCTYSKVKINISVNDAPTDEKIIEGCFMASEPDELGLIEITDQDKRFKVSYYKEQDPTVLKMLNVKFGNNDPIEWRTNKGHDLFITQKKDSLGFIFGDLKSTSGKVKGSILYIK